MQGHLNELSGKMYQAMFDPNAAISYEGIIEHLSAVREELIEHYHGLYLNELDQFIDKVHIFKTHFATLDIRQDHSKHKLVVETVLKKQGAIKESLDELKEKELVDLLLQGDYKLNPKDFDDDIVKDTILNIQNLKAIQDKNGEDGCNRYIISNSEDIFPCCSYLDCSDGAVGTRKKSLLILFHCSKQ